MAEEDKYPAPNGFDLEYIKQNEDSDAMIPLHFFYGFNGLSIFRSFNDFMRGTTEAIVSRIPGMGYLSEKNYVRDSLVYTRYRGYSSRIV